MLRAMAERASSNHRGRVIADDEWRAQVPASARRRRRHPAPLAASPAAQALPGDARRFPPLAGPHPIADPLPPLPASARPHRRTAGLRLFRSSSTANQHNHDALKPFTSTFFVFFLINNFYKALYFYLIRFFLMKILFPCPWLPYSWSY